jgi:hypothetical protein
VLALGRARRAGGAAGRAMVMRGTGVHGTCSGRGWARGGWLLRVRLALLGAMQRCWSEAARWCGRCEVSSGGVDRCESIGGSWQAAVASCAGSGSKPGGLGEDGPALAGPGAALAGGPALAGLRAGFSRFGLF